MILRTHCVDGLETRVVNVTRVTWNKCLSSPKAININEEDDGKKNSNSRHSIVYQSPDHALQLPFKSVPSKGQRLHANRLYRAPKRFGIRSTAHFMISLFACQTRTLCWKTDRRNSGNSGEITTVHFSLFTTVSISSL